MSKKSDEPEADKTDTSTTGRTPPLMRRLGDAMGRNILLTSAVLALCSGGFAMGFFELWKKVLDGPVINPSISLLEISIWLCEGVFVYDLYTKYTLALTADEKFKAQGLAVNMLGAKSTGKIQPDLSTIINWKNNNELMTGNALFPVLNRLEHAATGNSIIMQHEISNVRWWCLMGAIFAWCIEQPFYHVFVTNAWTLFGITVLSSFAHYLIIMHTFKTTEDVRQVVFNMTRRYLPVFSYLSPMSADDRKKLNYKEPLEGSPEEKYIDKLLEPKPSKS